jgi:hypothetical protein
VCDVFEKNLEKRGNHRAHSETGSLPNITITSVEKQSQDVYGVGEGEVRKVSG